MYLKKGDMVIVISGNDKGKSGQVLDILKAKNKVVVEGVNIITRHERPSNEHPDGGIFKKEAPISASNVQLLDPETKKPTRVGIKMIGGKKVRFAKRSGKVIDK